MGAQISGLRRSGLAKVCSAAMGLRHQKGSESTPIISIPYCCYLPVLTRFGRYDRIDPSHPLEYHRIQGLATSRVYGGCFFQRSLLTFLAVCFHHII